MNLMMKLPINPPPALADEVSRDLPNAQAALARVGMEGIELPIRFTAEGETFLLPAKVSAWVDLNAGTARGIHMSRLYALSDEHLGRAAPDRAVLRALLDAFLQSHDRLSSVAGISIDAVLPLRRPALLSGLSGWRQYPFQLHAERTIDGRFVCELEVQVLYSSTCPGSAAMARQLVQQKFSQVFGEGEVDAEQVSQWLASPEGGGIATPHAQRSVAQVRVRLSDAASDAVPVAELIDRIETALATSVQAAVKRIDEQEFARLNGANPMYCEDAARRLIATLETDATITDYRIRVAHLESLHPHDAVAVAVKGIVGGFVAG